MLNTTNSENLFSSSNSKNFKTIFDIHKTNSYTTLQTTLQSYKMPITTDYNVFAQNYHNKSLISGMDDVLAHIQNQHTLIKELREENEKLKNEKEKIVEKTTQHLNMAETLYEGVVKENDKLKKEDEELEEEMEQLERKYDNLVEKVGENGYEFDNLEEKYEDLEEEVCNLNRNIRMDKSIIQNLILSLIATKSDWFEWQMKDKYDITGVDIYEKYKNDMINELVKDMNDNDWNDDNNSLEIIYKDKNFEVVFHDTESEEEEEEEKEEEEEYVEDINGYKVNMAQIKYMADKFNMSMEQVKEIAKVSDCDYTKE